MAHLNGLPEIPVDPDPRVPRWATEVLFAIPIAAAAFVPSPIAEFAPTSTLARVLVLLPLLILPWRRRRPVAVLGLLLAVFGAAAATGTLSPGVGFAIAVAMFAVTVRGPRRRGIVIGACAVVVIMLLTLLASIGTVLDPRVFQFGLVVAFAAAAGDGARSRKAYIHAITERAERAVQSREDEARRRVVEERLRIARDLHDTVAHQIAVISLNAGVASSAVDARPDKAKESLATIRTAARTVLSEIGDLLIMLRSAEEHGPQPQAGIGRLDDLAAQFGASGLEVQTRVEGDLSQVDGTAGLVAYRVVQEALTNAHKHGAEHRAHVLVSVDDDALTLTITNPAPTAQSPRESTSSGLGLVGLRERVSSVRGTVDAGPTPAGWRVLARLPLAKEDTR